MLKKNKLRVVHIVESFAGGTLDFLVELCKGLTDMEHIIIHGNREDTPPDYLVLFNEKNSLYQSKYLSKKIDIKRDSFALIELICFLRQIKKIDIIHLHSSKAGFLGRIASKITGMSNITIYTSHGASFLRKDISENKKKVFVFLERVAYCFGGKVVACSRSEADQFKKHGIKTVIFINNGVADFKSVDLSHGNIEKKILTIGTIGRICSQKNPDVFNEIAGCFRERVDINFLWIGDGELKERLSSKNIHITGWVQKNEVKKEVGKMDVYISTSLWEGLSLGVLQAMSAGKPLILSDCVGNRDAVVNGWNGYAFQSVEEAINKIERIVDDKDILKLSSENSRRFFEDNFTIEKMVSNYRDLYNNIIDSKKY